MSGSKTLSSKTAFEKATAESVTLFEERIKLVNEYVALQYNIFPSQSGIKNHGYVELSRSVVSEYERILLQLLLGSDSIREGLSWAMVGKDPHPVLFIEKENLI